MPRAFAALLLTGALAGCGGATAPDRTGAPAARPEVLRVQATDAGSPEAAYFARRVEERSGRALRVELKEDYPASRPANEARLARDLRGGRADFGVLPARAWPAAGVPAFAALQAPFVLSTYAAARAALAGPAGPTLERALARAGVTALGIVPAELRRVLATRPLGTPAAFRGARVRVVDNATSAAVLRALGAVPVQGVTASGVERGLRRRELDGVETAPLWAVTNSYAPRARHLTGYALFDRVDTVVASADAWRRLAPPQRAALRAAARDTAAYAATLEARERDDLKQLCAAGVVIDVPTSAQLAAIAAATEPVRAALRRDEAAGPVLAQLERTAGAGPRVLPAPASCRPAAPQARTRQGRIPDGTYVVRTSVADFRRFGQYGPDWERPIVWTIRLDRGRWRLSQEPDYPDAGPGSGTYTVRGDTVRFRIYKPALDANPPWTVRWSYYRGTLSFKLLDVSDIGLRVIFGAHPWRKVR